MTCQAHEGCQQEAKRKFYTRWLCLWHFYRAYRDLEMNNDEPEAA